jgi:transcriptional regulator with XRE-family HTH domain
MNQTKIIARNLKKRRKELKLTQQDAAKLLEIKRCRYSSWEEERAEPGTMHLVKLTEVLKIDDLYLFLSRQL